MKRVVAIIAAVALTASPAWARTSALITPEPSTVALMAGGLVALVFVASKRKKR
jgi:hypothetical protein